jgi:hypothetical protein
MLQASVYGEKNGYACAGKGNRSGVTATEMCGDNGIVVEAADNVKKKQKSRSFRSGISATTIQSYTERKNE